VRIYCAVAEYFQEIDERPPTRRRRATSRRCCPTRLQQAYPSTDKDTLVVCNGARRRLLQLWRVAGDLKTTGGHALPVRRRKRQPWTSSTATCVKLPHALGAPLRAAGHVCIRGRPASPGHISGSRILIKSLILSTSSRSRSIRERVGGRTAVGSKVCIPGSGRAALIATCTARAGRAS
jgi:hypothetical protein